MEISIDRLGIDIHSPFLYKLSVTTIVFGFVGFGPMCWVLFKKNNVKNKGYEAAS